MNGSQNNSTVACEMALEYLIEMKGDKLILWWIIMCWNAFYEINLSGLFFIFFILILFFIFLVEFCVWQTMDGSSGSDFLHVWGIHRSCIVGQHGRQVCRQPIIPGSEMVTICSSGCFKRIQKNQNFFPMLHLYPFIGKQGEMFRTSHVCMKYVFCGLSTLW